MNNDLKGCPFCGSEVELKKAPLLGTWAILCYDCGADLMFYGAEKSKYKMIEKFNSRKGVTND